MPRLCALLALVLAALCAPVRAVPVMASQSYAIEEWSDGRWIETGRGEGRGPERFLAGSGPEAVAQGARYGPFRVLGPDRAELSGATDWNSPADFAAMLRDFPGIRVIEMADCPGTLDDLANLRLGRMIRAAGIATHVPAHGSVRSGAVELFLAGASRTIEEGARFAVHSWMDEDGRQASDYAATAPENRKYLAYYGEMGMDARQAAAFYALTNSVPHQQARWLSAAEMRQWLAPAAAPRLAYLDLSPMLP